MDSKLDLENEEVSQSVPVKELFLLNRAEIQRYWGQIERALDEQPELWNGAWTKDDLLANAIAGNVQVWALSVDNVLTLVLMTQFYSTFTTKYLQVFWAFGENLIETASLLDGAFDYFAAQHGASKFEVVGRKGFERVLRPLGFSPTCVTFMRDVRAPRGN